MVGATIEINPKSGSRFPDFEEQWQGTSCPWECAWGRQHIIVQVAESQAIERANNANGVARSARITTRVCMRRTA
jgi:hypothetical protein